jgi:DNA mismatch repair ATPase MutS
LTFFHFYAKILTQLNYKPKGKGEQMDNLKRIEAKIDLTFGLVANQVIINENLMVLEQITRAIAGLTQKEQAGELDDNMKKRLEELKKQADMLANTVDENRKTLGRIITLYNNVFGEEADKTLSELVELDKKLKEQNSGIQAQADVKVMASKRTSENVKGE